MGGSTCENSTVFPSLPLAIKWLRESVQQNQSVRYQVMLIWKIYLVLNFTTCMCVYYTE
jgi:folylpolyglutamate synthase